MSKVIIYQFKIYNIDTDERQTSRRWGTLEGIKGVCGTVLEDTEIEVDASEVGSEIPGLTVRNFSPHESEGFQKQVRP